MHTAHDCKNHHTDVMVRHNDDVMNIFVLFKTKLPDKYYDMTKFPDDLTDIGVMKGGGVKSLPVPYD